MAISVISNLPHWERSANRVRRREYARGTKGVGRSRWWPNVGAMVRSQPAWLATIGWIYTSLACDADACWTLIRDYVTIVPSAAINLAKQSASRLAKLRATKSTNGYSLTRRGDTTCTRTQARTHGRTYVSTMTSTGSLARVPYIEMQIFIVSSRIPLSHPMNYDVRRTIATQSVVYARLHKPGESWRPGFYIGANDRRRLVSLRRKPRCYFNRDIIHSRNSMQSRSQHHSWHHAIVIIIIIVDQRIANEMA